MEDFTQQTDSKIQKGSLSEKLTKLFQIQGTRVFTNKSQKVSVIFESINDEHFVDKLLLGDEVEDSVQYKHLCFCGIFKFHL